MKPSLRALSPALVALLFGCGGAGSGSTPSAATTESGTTVPFDDLSEAQQKEFMRNVVLPTMSKVFKASPEPEHFEPMGCPTCHGEGAKTGDFEMPSPHLPKFASYEEAEREHPEMARYMAEKVTPQMMKLLGEPPYDPETDKGFGCFDCHVKSE